MCVNHSTNLFYRSLWQTTKENMFQCNNCCNQHGPGQSPAYKQTCKKCYKLNHFAKCCRSVKKSVTPPVDQVNNDPGNPEAEVGNS